MNQSQTLLPIQGKGVLAFLLMSSIRLLSIVLLVSFAFTTSAQQIFKWQDKKGQWHFSDTPPPGVTPEKVRGLDISPKSSPAISPYEKPEQSQPASQTERFVIPFTRKGEHIIVEGIVNKRGSVKFILDTGASGTWVPKSQAQQLGIDPDRGFLLRRGGIGGSVVVPMVEIDSIKVGGAEVRDIIVVVSTLGRKKYKRKMDKKDMKRLDIYRLPRIKKDKKNKKNKKDEKDEMGDLGLLGADFLGEFRVDIKYGENQLILERNQTKQKEHSYKSWQRRFRLYHDAEKFYKEVISIERKFNWPTGFTAEYGPGEAKKQLEIVGGKLRALESRASRAAIPRKFRK